MMQILKTRAMAIGKLFKTEDSFYLLAMCCPMAFLSTKDLLTHQNWRYPMLLSICHLVTAAILEVTLDLTVFRARARKRVFDLNISTPFEIVLAILLQSQTFLVCSIMVLACTAVVANATTTVMMVLLAHFIHLCLSCIMVRYVSGWDGLRLSLVAVSSFFVMKNDYKISAESIVFITGSAIALALVKSYRQHAYREVRTPKAFFYIPVICYLVYASWLMRESPTQAYESWSSNIGCSFAINIACTAPLIVYVRRVVFTTYRTSEKLKDYIHTEEVILSVWTAAVVCFVLRTHNRVSASQLLAFFVGNISLDAGRLFGFARRSADFNPTNDMSIFNEINIEGQWAKMTTPPRRRRVRGWLFLVYSVILFTLTFRWRAIELGRSQFVSDATQGTSWTDKQASRPMDIVINFYKEHPYGVQEVVQSLKALPGFSNSTVFLYTKSVFSNITSLEGIISVDNVTQLPNVGREGHTYLHHIVNKYDDLAAHTLFVQADFHDPHQSLIRISDYFDPQHTGFLSLGPLETPCQSAICSDAFKWRDPFPIQRYCSLTNSDPKQCKQVVLTYNGQFIASAARIRGTKLEVWEELLSLFEHNDNWAHKQEYLQGRYDTLNNPVMGKTLERMWGMLLHCNDMRVARECPSLLGGSMNRKDVRPEDCQCFDTPL